MPGAREDGVLGWQDGVLGVRVRAPAERGRANDAVCRLLARLLDLPPSAVSIERGSTSREKSVTVEGLDERQLEKRIKDAGA